MDSRLILKDFIEGNGFELALSAKTFLRDYNISTDSGHDISTALSSQYVSRSNAVAEIIKSRLSLQNLSLPDKHAVEGHLMSHSKEVLKVIQNMLDLRTEGQHQADKIELRVKSLSLEIQQHLDQAVDFTQSSKSLTDDVQSAIGRLSG